MKNFKEIKKAIAKHKIELQQRFNIIEIGVFGSFVRKEHNKKSDIDILIEFKQGHKTFDNYMELKFFLEDLLGLKVDLVMKSAIRKELKEAILEEVVYA
jgi:hypothetical protein